MNVWTRKKKKLGRRKKQKKKKRKNERSMTKKGYMRKVKLKGGCPDVADPRLSIPLCAVLISHPPPSLTSENQKVVRGPEDSPGPKQKL